MRDLASRAFSGKKGWPWLGRRPAWVRYALAAALVVAAFFARMSLDKFLGQESHPYATFYVAVALAEFLLGLGPGLTVLGLGLVASLWFIVPPRNAPVVRGPSDVVEILLYFFVTGTVVALMEWLQRARREASDNALLAKARQLEIEKAREHLEQLVDERTARLRKTVEELEHFSYALTHDMRAPLRAMRSYAELIKEECVALTPQGHEFCQRIMAAAERLDLLICDSLNYTKILREDLPLHPVSLNRFLRDLIETYPKLEQHKSHMELAPDLPSVLANEAGLAQCFANLLDNAVKFTQPGRALEIRIWGQKREQRVRIHVQDNGPGIPHQARHRLFGIFQRLNSEHEGTGIGLAIVRKVVERMGGTVGFTSEQGKGSCFWVEFPAAPEPIDRVNQPVIGPAPRQQSGKDPRFTLSPATASD